jgi:predicted nucleic acid-binding protein
MPNSVFVDTVAWIALVNTRDSLHLRARETFDRLLGADALFVTSEFVLIELGNALSAPEIRSRTAGFIGALNASTAIVIVASGTELFQRGLELFGERSDKAWSLVDCTSFVIMADQGITEAFTEDRHFEQAGFVKLL